MKPTGDYRIDLGSRNEMRRSEAEGRSPKAIAKRRASARAGHRRIACPESSARELGRPRGNAPKSGARREPSAQAEPEGRASGCAKAQRGVGLWVKEVIIITARDDFAWLGQCGSSEGTGKCRERRDRAAAPPDRSGDRMRGFTHRAVNSYNRSPRPDESSRTGVPPI